MSNPKNFIIMAEYRDAVEVLSLEQKGKLLDAMFAYNLDGVELELEPIIKMAFKFMKNAFDTNRIKYEEKCKKNAENARKGWENRNPDMRSQANRCGNMQENALVANTKANTNNDSNLITNTEISPNYHRSNEASNKIKTIDHYISEAQDYWNKQDNLPKCNLTLASLSEPGKMATKIKDTGLETVRAAIDRLNIEYPKIEKKFRPKSFQRFIANSIDNWIPAPCDDRKEDIDPEVKGLLYGAFPTN